MDIYTIDKSNQLRILRQKALAIENIDNNIAQTAEEMIKAMQSGNGIGLAGPQVGLLQRIFTVQLPDETPIVFINPRIAGTSPEKSQYEEGCLSIPGQYGRVDRPSAVQVQAWNTRGRPFTMEADGLLARVIQHEIDHLNGILFIDYLSPNIRKKILRHFGIALTDYPDTE